MRVDDVAAIVVDPSFVGRDVHDELRAATRAG
jgi:hypothetical protein